ncbi:uncharacterized protein LOC116347406, partial [Contarinia nasturtii]|uniref:uncharacterized protein LOC116347406 n=1 Tax=Contarinia nasturtii TaxID=265458 RepID=UPI0012D3AEEA
DIFENFRETCHSIYNLDPAHYYTAPGLSWDAMLKYTRVQIELFTDVDMIYFIESSIRGGIAQVSHRYAKANNRYMNEKFDPNTPENYIMYFDANNLYGHAMSQSLPIGDYQWVENNNNKIIDDYDANDEDAKSEKWLYSQPDAIMNLPDDGQHGYIFEVDLHYPESLHDMHNDFPLCAEKRRLPDDAMLKLALRHGMILKKVHRILKFRQSAWLKEYIDLNTEMRTKAKNDFEKNFFKLMNNSIFGKTMESVRNYRTLKLVNKWFGRNGARTYISRPDFEHCRIFDDSLVALEMRNTNIVMNKPIAIGMCVLDLSKITMYSFLYEFIKPYYGDKAHILYSDTDSFIMDVETSDFYEDMRKNSEKYDTSDYPLPNVFNLERKNKKIPGCFKDEMMGNIIYEFVGLRAKCYAINTLVKKLNDSNKKAKGTKKIVVRNKIQFSDYVACVMNRQDVTRQQNSFRSINHNIYTISQNKIALNPFDDKRYVKKPDYINTLAWGHYSIKSLEK